MKNWLKNKTWEDIAVYSFLALAAISIIVFLSGFLFGFKIDTPKNPLHSEVSGSINRILFGKDTRTINQFLSSNTSVDAKSLFTLFKTIPSGTQFDSLRAMATCTIAGFSLIMITIFLFLSFAIVVFGYEVAWPWISKKYSKN